MSSKPKSILAAAVASHALTHVAELTFPATALLVTLEFFGQKEGYSQIGFATFISALLFGVSALPSGWLVDRLGARRILLTFLFGTGLSLAALSLMPGFASFTVALAGLGFFSGLYHPAGATMITLGMDSHGRAMGAHGMGGNLGLALTPFFAAGLAGLLGWRGAYAALSVLPLGLGLWVLLSGLSVTADSDEEIFEPGELKPGAGGLIHPAALAILFVMAVFNGMTYRGLMTFLPAYFAERVKMGWLPVTDVTVGGAMTTAILLLGVLGQFIGGNLADRLKKEKFFTAIFFLAAPVLLLVGVTRGPLLVAVTGGFALLYFMNQPVGNSMLPRYTSQRVRGMVFGLFFFVNFGAGSVMSWIAGVVGDRFELSDIFTMFAACLLAAGLIGIGLVKRTRGID